MYADIVSVNERYSVNRFVFKVLAGQISLKKIGKNYQFIRTFAHTIYHSIGKLLKRLHKKSRPVFELAIGFQIQLQIVTTVLS